MKHNGVSPSKHFAATSQSKPVVCMQGPSLQMIRRHSRGTEQMHYGPALHTVTGNYVAGKRKGVIGGVDFGSTGMVCMA